MWQNAMNNPPEIDGSYPVVWREQGASVSDRLDYRAGIGWFRNGELVNFGNHKGEYDMYNNDPAVVVQEVPLKLEGRGPAPAGVPKRDIGPFGAILGDK